MPDSLAEARKRLEDEERLGHRDEVGSCPLCEAYAELNRLEHAASLHAQLTQDPHPTREERT